MKTLRITDSFSVLLCLTPSLLVTRVSQSTMLLWTCPIGRTRASRLITKDCWVAGVISQLRVVAAGSWDDVRRNFAGEHGEEKSSLLKRLEEAVGSKAVDHQCLNEEGESHNNPRNAVTVQDLATWSQCHQCNTHLTRNDENQEDNEGSLQKFLELTEKPVQN